MSWKLYAYLYCCAHSQWTWTTKHLSSMVNNSSLHPLCSLKYVNSELASQFLTGWLAVVGFAAYSEGHGGTWRLFNQNEREGSWCLLVRTKWDKQDISESLQKFQGISLLTPLSLVLTLFTNNTWDSVDHLYIVRFVFSASFLFSF